MNRLMLYLSPQRTFSKVQCWSCKATCGTLFCPLCRLPQPMRPKLNYYELLLPQEASSPKSKGIHLWRISLTKLHQHYISLQRSVHPDVFVRFDSKTRALGQEQSSIINKAYKTLKNDLQRALYISKLYGVPINENDAEAPNSALQELFTFVLESQESLEEAQSSQEVMQIQEAVNLRAEKVKSEFETLLEILPNPIFEKANSELVTRLKKLVIRMQFFEELKQCVCKKMGEFS